MKKGMLKVAIATTGMLLLSSISVNAQKPGHQKPDAEAIIAKMDADKDGKLSEAEVHGPLKEKFSVIDADADGFITKEEMAHAPKREKTMAE